MATAADNGPPDDAGNVDEARLYARLRRLVERLGNGLDAAEFLDKLLELSGDGGKKAKLSLENAFLAVMIRRGCPSTLLAEVERVLRGCHPGRTVKAAARDAKVDRRTLNRQWRKINNDRDLSDLFRLVKLVHVVRAPGSAQERACAAGICVRTVNKASLELTRRPLQDLIGEPTEIIRLLEEWFIA